MSIVYEDEIKMLSDETKITKEIKLDPELYIYIQKLMKEQIKSFDEIVNNMIRGHAEDSLKTIKYIQQYYTTNYTTDYYNATRL